MEKEASYFLPKFIELPRLDAFSFLLIFLDACFVSSSTVILGSLEKKSLAGSNYFSRVFGEVFDVALTLLLRRSKRSWSAALRVFSSFYYSSPERDFLLYRSVCFWLIKNSIKKCCLWPSSHDCKLRIKK